MFGGVAISSLLIIACMRRIAVILVSAASVSCVAEPSVCSGHIGAPIIMNIMQLCQLREGST